MTPITGSIVALVTPMHEDGSVDYPALRKLVDWHIQEGTDCIGVVGTTGESPTVDVEEHQEIIRVAVEQANGRVPIMAGCGANSTVDRGSTGDTVIGVGTRIDNLVQIGHNVRLGRCCIIVAQVGIAGSTVVEDFVQLGGQVAIAGHLLIGEAARIGAQSGVMSDVAPSAVLVGTPAQPRRTFFKQIAILKKLANGRPPRSS